MRGQISNHAATMANLREDSLHHVRAEVAPGGDELVLGRSLRPVAPPTAGFDHYYGSSTARPISSLAYDNHRVRHPRGRRIRAGLVDHAIGFIHDAKSVRPDRPFFTYLAFGATHAPHQAPPEYLERHRGRYDDGWDVARDKWFARQKDLGIVPDYTELAPRNSEGPEPTVGPTAREPETTGASAGGLRPRHTDAQIGRLIADLRTGGSTTL